MDSFHKAIGHGAVVRKYKRYSCRLIRSADRSLSLVSLARNADIRSCIRLIAPSAASGSHIDTRHLCG